MPIRVHLYHQCLEYHVQNKEGNAKASELSDLLTICPLLVEAAFDNYWGSGLDKKWHNVHQFEGVGSQEHHGPNSDRFCSFQTSKISRRTDR